MLVMRKMRRLLAILCAVVLVAGCTGCGAAGNNGGDRKEKKVTEKPSEPTPTEKPSEPLPTNPAKPTGAPVSGESRNLTAGSSGEAPETKAMDDKMRTAYETFAYKMFGLMGTGSTKMISPFSIYTALAMLDNGADAETLAQIDAVLGLTAEERNAYMASWIAKLTGGSAAGAKFTNADSIWIRNSLESYVPKEFLDACAKYYKASVYSTPMDGSTISAVNQWVFDNTMGMIDKILDELSPSASMILLNAIALDAKWADPFKTDYIREDYTFTREDGTTKKVEMMFGEADYGLLENDLATGFTKAYQGGEFSYVALLPKEGVSLTQLTESLKPGIVKELWQTKRSGEVHIGLPKYKEEYTVTLNDALQQLGMKNAFDQDLADFTKLMDYKDGNTFVNSVLHKTFISVDNEGTKAAAVTAILMDTATSIEQPQIFYVTLDRPFVYMIVDADGLPVFIGTYE